MKMQAERIEGLNAIARHAADGVVVNGVEHRRSVLVPWAGDVADWPVNGFVSLAAEHFEQVAALGPEIVIFGSGTRLRFPPAAAMRVLIERRIGFETMDVAAAARTYNVLLSEGRRVVAALLFEQASPAG